MVSAYFSGGLRRPCILQSYEEADRIPKIIRIRYIDLFCLLWSVCGAVIDVSTDVWVAVFYFRTDRALYAGLVLAFTVLPSLLIAVVNLCWYLHDTTTFHREISAIQITFIVLQLSISARYFNALTYAIAFFKQSRRPGFNPNRDNKELYMRMLEEERDAMLLRLVECFLESTPQLLLQLYILGQQFWTDGYSSKMWHQIPSICASAISISWALVSQHRSLRFTRQDKENPSLLGSCVQFLWRLFTVMARFTALVCFTLHYGCWLSLLLGLRFIVMMFVIVFWDNVDMFRASAKMERFIFKVIAGAVHLFVPVTVSEGSTLRRYVSYYTLEAVENLAITLIPALDKTFSFPNKWALPVFTCSCFALGVLCMNVYYKWFHPLVRVNQRDSASKNTFDVFSTEANVKHHVEHNEANGCSVEEASSVPMLQVLRSQTCSKEDATM